MDQRIVDLYDEFTHGTMSRREMLDRLGRLAGGSAAALALLPLLQNDTTKSGLIPEDDDRLRTEQAPFQAGEDSMSGYLARPKELAKRPSVIVIHENRGLNAHIKDVARRMAAEGFLTFAPDMLSHLGGTPADSDQARTMIRGLDADETVVRLAAAVSFLADHEESTGKVGAVGFCWGGGMANRLAAAGTSLAASVPYYGRQLPAEDVPRVSGPLLLHYAGLDERINAGIAEYEAALKAHDKPYQVHMYEGVNHAFNNDTSASRYDKAAAELAWSRTVAFFKEHLAT